MAMSTKCNCNVFCDVCGYSEDYHYHPTTGLPIMEHSFRNSGCDQRCVEDSGMFQFSDRFLLSDIDNLDW